MKPRKKLGMNGFNRTHIHLIWGNDHVVTVKIPHIINNYNYWVLGVDLVDQLIGYYQPKFVAVVHGCHCSYMVLMLFK